MARKDIDVRIRAEDKASGNAKKIAGSLKQIAEDGRKATESAAKTGGAFGALAADVAKLQGNISELKSIGGVVGQMDKAAGAVGRLEKQLDGTQRGFTSVLQRTKELSAASAELRSRYDAEDAANKQRTADLKAATEAQKANKTAVEAAEKALKRYNDELYVRGRGKSRAQVSTVLNPEQMAQGSSLMANLGSAEATRTKIESTINGLRTSISAASKSLNELGAELQQVTGHEKEFAQETMDAGNRVLKLNVDLHQARQTLNSLESEVLDANKALGTLAFSQDDVAKASAKAEAELRQQARALEVFERFATQKNVRGGRISDSTPAETAQRQADAMRIAKEEVALLRAEQIKLDAAVKAGSGNITAQADAYARMSKAVQLAEEQVRKLQIQQRLAESTGAKTGYAKWIAGYENAARTAVVAQDRLNTSTTKTAATLGQIAPMAQRNAQSLRNQAGATDQASNALGGFGRNTRTTLSFMQRMRGEVLALTSGFLGFYAALNRGQKAMDSFMAVEKAENRLSVAFNADTGKVAQEIAYLNAEADRLGFTFEALANGYGKLSISAQAAGFSIADTRELFTSVAQAGRVSGLSIDEMNGVLKAFDQILSKGKLTAEEVRGQVGERLSGAFTIFAQALGMTSQELDAAMKKGEVYADRDTMGKVAERLEQMFGKNVPAAMRSLAASIGTFERDMEKVNVQLANGFVPAVQAALKAFHEFANSAEGAETFRAVGEAAGDLIAALGVLVRHMDLVIDAAKILLAVGLARGISSIASSAAQGIAGLRGYSAQLLAASQAGQRMTLTQRTLGMGFVTLTTGMRNYERTLLSSTSKTAMAAAGNRALAGTVGALRIAMVGVGTAFRALGALLGGPIGIAIAAISIGLMAWKTDADVATAAMKVHERQVLAVRNAYDAATGEAAKLKAAAAAVALPDAMDSLANQQRGYNSALSRIGDIVSRIEEYKERVAQGPTFANEVIPDTLAGEITQIEDAIASFLQSGDPDAFVISLNKIFGAAENPAVKAMAEELLAIATGAGDSEQSIKAMQQRIKEAAGIVEAAGGTISDATRELLGLNGAVEETSAAFDKSSLIKTYSDAIDELKSKIPGLADEMKRLKDITELNQTAWAGLTAAWKAGDYGKMFEIAGLWGQGVNAQNNAAFGGAGGASTAGLIKQFEGFIDTAKWDVNHFRVGYGSDTVTLSDGSVRQVVEGMTTTLADANRDLARRIGEFQNTVKSEIGADRFNAFSPDQQAAITSVAYNYGNLSRTGELDAFKNGTVEQIAEAIRRLASHNDGINAGRRNQEADLFAGGGTSYALGQQQFEADTEAAKKAAELAKSTKDRIADLDHQISQQTLINAGKEREAAIEDAIRQAKAENAGISETDLATIRERAGAQWDLANATKETELAEERINQLQTLRQALMEQRDQAVNAGDATQIAALDKELVGVNLRLQEAIDKSIAMWTAIGGPEAEAKLATLKTLQGSIKAAEQQTGAFGLSMGTWFGIFRGAVTGIVGVFDSFAQAIANGENAFEAFGMAALQVLAQVLQQIAAAIIQFQILNMLKGGMFGSGIAGFATQMLKGGMAGHTGGVVGSRGIGSGNSIGRPTWVDSAFTYHTGGIAGLRPDEVSATLRKGEEILTEEDPRHRDNLGGESTSGQGTRLNQILAIGDKQAEELVAKYGKDAILTTIKTNASTIRRLLGT